MVKFIGVDVSGVVPPPYCPPAMAGLVTVTGTAPAFMTAVAGMEVCSLVALTKVVAIFVPLKLMTALAAKFVPSTSNGTALLAVALGGFNCAMVGMAPAAG